MTLGYYGSGEFGGNPYGSIPAQVGVLSAEALNGQHVQVNFTEQLDFSLTALLIPANYSIPGLTVVSVEETAANAVLLTTSPQTNINYTVTVVAARSVYGTNINPAQNFASFTGFPLNPGYFAVATGASRVRAVFSSVMLNDSNLSNSSNYTITDFNGNAVFIVSATPEQNIGAGGALSVLLALSTPLTETQFYVCTVSSNIHTLQGYEVLPPTSVFQWVQGINQFQVPTNLFSGEVTGFPIPVQFGGLVYFSPALNTPTPNSIIQVEEVDVCSTAYDQYVMPAPVDPTPLFTYGGGIVPTPNPDPYLLNQCVLWAPFPRNFEAQIILGFTGEANQDIFAPPVDTSCSAIIKDQFAYGFVALLNDPAYYLLPKSTPPKPTPPMFITANNLAPIPPGKETILILHVGMGGTSSFAPAPAKVQARTSVVMPGTSQLFAGAGPPPVVLTQAALLAGSNMLVAANRTLGAVAPIAGQAFVTALASGVNPPPLNQLVCVGTSTLVVFGDVQRSVVTAPVGRSIFQSMAKVTRGAQAHPSTSSTMSGTAYAQWAGRASILGASAVIADATVTHKAEAFPVGIASISGTAT